MDRGLKAPLSPNEENTLRRAAHAEIKLGDLNGNHVDRLVLLDLVSLDGDAIALTPLGRQRIFILEGHPEPTTDEDRLPPAREAAQKRREAEFFGLLGLAPQKPASNAKPKA